MKAWHIQFQHRTLQQATERQRGMKRKERATTPDAVEALQALQGFEFLRHENEGPNLLAGPRSVGLLPPVK